MNKPAPFKSLTQLYASHITAFEVVVMERFCSLRSIKWLTCLFKTASRLGDSSLWVSTGLMLVAINDSYSRMVAFSASLAIGTSVVLFITLKNLIGRPRPFESWDALTCMMAPPDKFSFPSGHTLTAFAVWGTFLIGYPVISHFYLVAAALIGLSRIFLGLHYPTDVLVGAILGSAIGIGFGSFLL